MVRSVRWLKNHGVTVRLGTGVIRYIPPDGSLTVGEARQLMGYGQMTLYRLRERGKIRFIPGAVARVALSELRRLKRESA